MKEEIEKLELRIKATEDLIYRNEVSDITISKNQTIIMQSLIAIMQKLDKIETE